MSEEMFNRLLDLVGTAGQGGFILAIVYLAKPYVVSAMWLSFGYLVVRFVTKTIMAFSAYMLAARTIASLVNYAPYNWDYFDANDAKKLCEQVEDRIKWAKSGQV